MLYFPHPLSCDDEGLLALGGDLSHERLELAYSFGIFPWFNQEPILWWFTHPRCVLITSQIKISKSMRRLVNNKRPWTVTMDTSFEEVIDSCSTVTRVGQKGTWISAKIKDAYIRLHESNIAHSVEVWSKDKQLIGGLYGIVRGDIFFGESMFARQSNTSKYALVHLAQYLHSKGCRLIDCQQDTAHMKSMGATLMPKDDFWQTIKQNALKDDLDISRSDFNFWMNHHANS